MPPGAQGLRELYESQSADGGILFLLEGTARSVAAVGSKRGAYCDFTCVAGIIILVVNTVLYVTLDPLDRVINTASAIIVLIHLIHLLFLG